MSARPGRIGPWRLLEIVHATLPLRAAMMGGAALLPEFGPPDPVPRSSDPDEELPGSNLGDGEQRQAISRERARRFLRARR